MSRAGTDVPSVTVSQVDELLVWISPTKASEAQRDDVVKFVQDLVERCFGQSGKVSRQSAACPQAASIHVMFRTAFLYLKTGPAAVMHCAPVVAIFIAAAETQEGHGDAD